MLNDAEKNVTSSSHISSEADDAANNTSQTDAALCNPMETDIEMTEDVSCWSAEVACAISVSENITALSEEEGRRSEKHSKAKIDKDNGAKSSKSSRGVIFHTKENACISSSEINYKHFDAANDSKSENINIVNDTSVVDVISESDKLNIRESEIEDREKFEQHNQDEDRYCEANVGGKVNIMKGDEAQRRETENENGITKLGHDDVDEGYEQAQVSNKKKKVMKKAERTGMIFMCNSRTKQDCFDYSVFGLPANMRDAVRKISKGTRLFLFDIDLRVMYGIYRAAARGGYNIEPNAFKSAFPSQVRFTVVEECTPLPEEIFKMAIKDSYYRRNMFNCQLTSEQVKILSKLFVAASGGPNFSFGKVKQENLIEQELDGENGIVKNKGIPATEEENEETDTGEEINNGADLIAKEKANELVCLKADRDEEFSCENNEERTTEGMVFLCNSTTRQDCLDYKVLGLPANMRKIVQKVYKGMKLFMFDVDLKLMYGIYKAAEPGGYNIEPKAFNSCFPSQVRFTVVQDCSPLPEEKFREVIIDNYYWKNKFNCQLTSEQVNKLSKLFVAASRGPDLNKVDVANNTQRNRTIFSQVDMNVKVNLVTKEYPIEEDVGANPEEILGKKRKRGKERRRVQKTGNTGMIFMCNSTTKQDCLYYKVLGLPANMREIVKKVQKGTRLFMFDVDLRVMHGIFKAAGPGGYNIEPKAFNSGFPSQARFTVLEDCVPLREEEFRSAIEDNYFTKWKFTGELTSEQVKNLCKIFSSASKGRYRTRQQNLERGITNEGKPYIQRVLVPMAQIPPLDYTPINVSHGKGSVIRSGPLSRPHGQRRVRYRQLRNHDVTVRSKDRKKLYVKEIEMKSRYLEGECRRLEMLLQYSTAENQSLRVSLQNAMAVDNFH